MNANWADQADSSGSEFLLVFLRLIRRSLLFVILRVSSWFPFSTVKPGTTNPRETSRKEEENNESHEKSRKQIMSACHTETYIDILFPDERFPCNETMAETFK
ncbi:MAG: hypothetical protein DMF63_00210 [Acidobacteria bacterium]|nr:MAG: hypothetical protein DMF63_00210 [Acidobacteriota bacterium]